MPAHCLRRLTIDALPEGFGTTAEVEANTGRKERSVRNDCIEEGIAISVVRPMGGREWAVYERGAAALPRGDNPGNPAKLGDARRLIAYLGERLAEAGPCDTGMIVDACRDAVSLDTGAPWAA